VPTPRTENGDGALTTAQKALGRLGLGGQNGCSQSRDFSVDWSTGLSPGDDLDLYRSISAIHDSVFKDERTSSRLTP
jgi:hypothetical protein